MAINQDKLHEFLGKAIVDFGAVFSAALIRIGDKLGLYKALSSGGPQTPAELARKTSTTERYLREWLSNQAAGGYVNYDAATGKFHMSEEQAFAMADESSPVFLPGAFQCALAATKAEEQLTERFKTGEGLGWHEHHHELFVGTERFFRPGYAANLIASRSPIALAVTLEAVRRAGRLDSLEEVLRQEFRTSCAALQSRDLVEGIRALLVDKDRNPRWSPASLAEVTPESIDAYFAPPRT